MRMKRVELKDGSPEAMKAAAELAKNHDLTWAADHWRSNAMELDKIRMMRQAIDAMPGGIIVVEFEN